MSVRFYNTTGWVVGIDLHPFQMFVPPDPLPVPMPCFPHLVVVPLSWGFSAEKSKLKNVTADGAPMLQKGHKLKLVPPHLGLGPPHPLELLTWAGVMAGSKTTCVMGVASVTGCGEPLATCLAGFWGLNLDCASPVNTPSGNVFNGNTVRTTPALSDYVNAGMEVVLANLETFIEHCLPKGSKVLKWFKKYKDIKKKTKLAEQVLKYLLKQINKTIPMPSDLEKKIDKAREELIRKLLGGHG